MTLFRFLQKLSIIFICSNLFFLSDTKAEGIYQFGTVLNQSLESGTEVFIHVPNAGDIIRVHLCERGQQSNAVSATVSSTTLVSGIYSVDTGLSNLSSPSGNISCSDDLTAPLPRTPATGSLMEFAVPSAGVYALTFPFSDPATKYVRWDFSVVPGGTPNASVDATDEAGAIFSYNWNLNAGGYAKAESVTANMFILVPGGFPNTNYVWGLDLQDFSGWIYKVIANDLGVDAPSSGRSTLVAGNTVTPKYPVYVSYPLAASPLPEPVQFPSLIDTLVFVDDLGNDSTISPDGDAVEETGNFQFTSDVDGTYAITIDINQDGLFGANDRLLLGRMSANVLNVVNWDGTDSLGTVVPNGSFPVKLELRVGEYHFVIEDVETSGGGTNDDGTGLDDGLTIFKATDASTLVGTNVFWDDETILSGASNLPDGVLSSAAVTGSHRHTWGDFTANSLGNNAQMDTYVYGNATTESVTANVAALNAVPTINNATFNIDENSAVSTAVGTPTAADADGDFLQYSISGGNVNSAFAVNLTTGAITVNGALDNETLAQYTLTVEVTDQASTASATITVDINDINDAPVISGTPSTSIAQDATYSFIPAANDQDGDALTFSISGQPSWASFNTSTGALTGTPSNADVGSYPNIVITVTSTGPLSASLAALTITVTNVNDAPVISGTPATSVAQDAAYSFVPTASDPDGDVLTFSISGQPSWASFNTSTGALTGTPSNADVGSYPNIVITVTSNGPLSASLAALTITVTNVNDAPVISGTPATSVAQDAAYSFVPTASDPDGDALTFSISGQPSWASFNTSTGALTGTPSNADVGSYPNIVITVTSTGPLSASLAAFSITVSNTNDAPTADSQSVSVIENGAINITLTGSDPDGDALTYTIVSNPGNGTLSGVIPDLVYTPNVDFFGSDNFTFNVNDGGFTSPLAVVTIDIQIDTDNDGIPDSTDLDDDNDGIPDSVEGNGDTDNDGIPDSLDTDSDNDGIPDSVEGNIDSDGDGIPDYLDISLDEDADGIPDIVEGSGDLDNDGLPDYFDIDSDNDGLTDTIESFAVGIDFDGDGIDDAFDVDQTGGDDANNDGIDDDIVESDTDNDGIVDRRDIDSDQDGVPDVIESVIYFMDTDGDGLSDLVDVDQTGGEDIDGDGIDDVFDVTFTLGLDPDLDGVDDKLLPQSDRDSDGVADYLDVDSDADGIADSAEAGIVGVDSDSDGIDDSYDIDSTGGIDINNDGIDDDVTVIDTDGDGVPDLHDLDSDNDSLFDTIEAAVADVDGNALADDNQLVFALLDTDNDGMTDVVDLDSDNDNVNDIDTSEWSSLDTDNDGMVDTTVDTDGDGIDDSQDELPNEHGTAVIDKDFDNDGIANITEGIGDNDSDGIADYLDRDSDNDGLSDAFETDRPAPLGMDEDSDGIDDVYDVDMTGGLDENNDGVDDQFVQVDTDNDTLPDYLDDDSDGDGIPDVVEQVLVALIDEDSDGDGIDDAVDVDFTGGVDLNSDGIDDLMLNQLDVDGDGIANYRDIDSDGDGILDEDEGVVDSDEDGVPDYLDIDSDNDGIPDSTEGAVDSDDDGIPDYIDQDSDGDGISDLIEGDTDADGDGIPNYLDLDSDGDGISDSEEGTMDTDEDGVADYLDTDSDGDGILDSDENGDFNGDGINDRYQVFKGVETGVSGVGSWSGLMFILMIMVTFLRRNKRVSALLTVSFLSMASTTIQANESCDFSEAFGKSSCWYVGAGIGESTLRPEVNDTSWVISDDKDTSIKLLTGFLFTDQLFTEFSYDYMGNAELYNLNPNIPGNLKINYSAISADIGFWFRNKNSKWNIYGKTGITLLNTSDSQYVDQNYSTQLSFGTGLQWRFDSDWFARLDFSYYDKDAKVVGITFARYLGRSKKSAVQPKVAPVAISQPVQEKPIQEPDLDGDGVLNEQDNCPETAKDTPVNQQGCPLMESITLNIQFDSNQSAVKTEFMLELATVIDKIKQQGEVNVTVEGHTDWQGSQVNNQKLSEARATAVAKILEEKTSLSKKHFTVKGFGESTPIADNKTEQGRYMNRRVVVILTQI